MNSISPFLWFDTEAEQAAELYVSLFEDSAIHSVSRTPDGAAFVVDFSLDGVRFQGMNGGRSQGFTEAISFAITAPTQERIDELWDALTADGGEPGRCGWLTDRFGVSWQVVPPQLATLLGSGDPRSASRVMQAMLGMQRLVIADLEAAAAG